MELLLCRDRSKYQREPRSGIVKDQRLEGCIKTIATSATNNTMMEVNPR